LIASGYFLNNHGAYSPKFKYIENNIEYIEDENFFENFQKSMKEMQNKVLKPININNIFMKKDKNNQLRDRNEGRDSNNMDIDVRNLIICYIFNYFILLIIID